MQAVLDLVWQHVLPAVDRAGRRTRMPPAPASRQPSRFRRWRPRPSARTRVGPPGRLGFGDVGVIRHGHPAQWRLANRSNPRVG